MNDRDHQPYIQRRSWPQKFAAAFRGMRSAIVGQSSFAVHFVMAAAVLVCGVLLRVSQIEWCVLVICIAIVLAAETFNSSLESLAKAIDQGYNDHLRVALDIASGGVLWTAIGAAAVGLIVFLRRLGQWSGWMF